MPQRFVGSHKQIYTNLLPLRDLDPYVIVVEGRPCTPSNTNRHLGNNSGREIYTAGPALKLRLFLPESASGAEPDSNLCTRRPQQFISDGHIIMRAVRFRPTADLKYKLRRSIEGIP